MRTPPSWPNHISKAILLNSKTGRLYVNTLISGRHKHSDHSRIFESESRSVLFTLCGPMDWSTGFSRPEYWSGWLSPSPGDLPNPGIGPRSPTLQADSSQLSHQGSPRILEWAACPFSSGSSQPRNQTGVSCIAGSLVNHISDWIVMRGLSNQNLKFQLHHDNFLTK